MRSILVLIILLTMTSMSSAAKIDTGNGFVHFSTIDQINTFMQMLQPNNNKYVEVTPYNFNEFYSLNMTLVGDRLGLDIPKGFKIDMVILEDLKALRSEYPKHGNGTKGKSVVAFYCSCHKTIFYAKSRLIRRYVLHEIAHAIIAKYFWKSIPSKIHEIIAEAVEYSVK